MSLQQTLVDQKVHYNVFVQHTFKFYESKQFLSLHQTCSHVNKKVHYNVLVQHNFTFILPS